MNKDVYKKYDATSLQQLTKIVTDENGEHKEKNVYPVSIIQAIFDGLTGTRLDHILSFGNCIYLLFQGTREATRLMVNSQMRRKGLIIVFKDVDNTIYTQRYINDNFDDASWQDDNNWNNCFVSYDEEETIKYLKNYIDTYIQENINTSNAYILPSEITSGSAITQEQYNEIKNAILKGALILSHYAENGDGQYLVPNSCVCDDTRIYIQFQQLPNIIELEILQSNLIPTFNVIQQEENDIHEFRFTNFNINADTLSVTYSPNTISANEATELLNLFNNKKQIKFILNDYNYFICSSFVKIDNGPSDNRIIFGGYITFNHVHYYIEIDIQSVLYGISSNKSINVSVRNVLTIGNERTFEDNQFLKRTDNRNRCEWTKIANATTDTDGLMSKEDKTKLDYCNRTLIVDFLDIYSDEGTLTEEQYHNIYNNINTIFIVLNTLEGTANAIIQQLDSSTDKIFIKCICNYNDEPNLITFTINPDYSYIVNKEKIIHNIATQSNNGLMSKEDKIKLDGLTGSHFQVLTQEEYDAIGTKDDNVIYFIKG